MGNKWRRERDSNPRYGFPQTRFPSVRLQPLGHPSTGSRFEICKVAKSLNAEDRKVADGYLNFNLLTDKF